jgi:trimeric autotransporter adhesin
LLKYDDYSKNVKSEVRSGAQPRDLEINVDDTDSSKVIESIEKQSPIIERELLTTEHQLENFRSRLAMSETVSAVTQSVLDSIRKEYNLPDNDQEVDIEYEKFKKKMQEDLHKKESNLVKSEMEREELIEDSSRIEKHSSQEEEEGENMQDYKLESTSSSHEHEPLVSDTELNEILTNVNNELREKIDEVERKMQARVEEKVYDVIKNFARESQSQIEKIMMVQSLDSDEKENEDEGEAELDDIKKQMLSSSEQEDPAKLLRLAEQKSTGEQAFYEKGDERLELNKTRKLSISQTRLIENSESDSNAEIGPGSGSGESSSAVVVPRTAGDDEKQAEEKLSDLRNADVLSDDTMRKELSKIAQELDNSFDDEKQQLASATLNKSTRYQTFDIESSSSTNSELNKQEEFVTHKYEDEYEKKLEPERADESDDEDRLEKQNRSRGFKRASLRKAHKSESSEPLLSAEGKQAEADKEVAIDSKIYQLSSSELSSESIVDTARLTETNSAFTDYSSIVQKPSVTAPLPPPTRARQPVSELISFESTPSEQAKSAFNQAEGGSSDDEKRREPPQQDDLIKSFVVSIIDESKRIYHSSEEPLQIEKHEDEKQQTQSLTIGLGSIKPSYSFVPIVDTLTASKETTEPDIENPNEIALMSTVSNENSEMKIDIAKEPAVASSSSSSEISSEAEETDEENNLHRRRNSRFQRDSEIIETVTGVESTNLIHSSDTSSDYNIEETNRKAEATESLEKANVSEQLVEANELVQDDQAIEAKLVELAETSPSQIAVAMPSSLLELSNVSEDLLGVKGEPPHKEEEISLELIQSSPTQRAIGKQQEDSESLYQNSSISSNISSTTSEENLLGGRNLVESTDRLSSSKENESQASSSNIAYSNDNLDIGSIGVGGSSGLGDEDFLNSLSSQMISKSLNYLESLVVASSSNDIEECAIDAYKKKPALSSDKQRELDEHSIITDKSTADEKKQTDGEPRKSVSESIKYFESLSGGAHRATRPVSFPKRASESSIESPLPQSVDSSFMMLESEQYTRRPMREQSEQDLQTPTPVENIGGDFFDKRITSSNEPSIDQLASKTASQVEYDEASSESLNSFIERTEREQLERVKQQAASELINERASSEFGDELLTNQMHAEAEAEVVAAVATALLFSSTIKSQSSDELKSQPAMSSNANDEQQDISEVFSASASNEQIVASSSGDEQLRRSVDEPPFDFRSSLDDMQMQSKKIFIQDSAQREFAKYIVLTGSKIKSATFDQFTKVKTSDESSSMPSDESTEIRPLPSSATKQTARESLGDAETTTGASGIDNPCFVDSDNQEMRSSSSNESMIINRDYDDSEDQMKMKIKIIQSNLPSKSISSGEPIPIDKFTIDEEPSIGQARESANQEALLHDAKLPDSLPHMKRDYEVSENLNKLDNESSLISNENEAELGEEYNDEQASLLAYEKSPEMANKPDSAFIVFKDEQSESILPSAESDEFFKKFSNVVQNETINVFEKVDVEKLDKVEAIANAEELQEEQLEVVTEELKPAEDIELETTVYDTEVDADLAKSKESLVAKEAIVEFESESQTLKKQENEAEEQFLPVDDFSLKTGLKELQSKEDVDLESEKATTSSLAGESETMLAKESLLLLDDQAYLICTPSSSNQTPQNERDLEISSSLKATSTRQVEDENQIENENEKLQLEQIEPEAELDEDNKADKLELAKTIVENVLTKSLLIVNDDSSTQERSMSTEEHETTTESDHDLIRSNESDIIQDNQTAQQTGSFADFKSEQAEIQEAQANLPLEQQLKLVCSPKEVRFSAYRTIVTADTDSSTLESSSSDGGVAAPDEGKSRVALDLVEMGSSKNPSQVEDSTEVIESSCQLKSKQSKLALSTATTISGFSDDEDKLSSDESSSQIIQNEDLDKLQSLIINRNYEDTFNQLNETKPIELIEDNEGELAEESEQEETTNNDREYDQSQISIEQVKQLIGSVVGKAMNVLNDVQIDSQKLKDHDDNDEEESDEKSDEQKKKEKKNEEEKKKPPKKDGDSDGDNNDDRGAPGTGGASTGGAEQADSSDEHKDSARDHERESGANDGSGDRGENSYERQHSSSHLTNSDSTSENLLKAIEEKTAKTIELCGLLQESLGGDVRHDLLFDNRTENEAISGDLLQYNISNEELLASKQHLIDSTIRFSEDAEARLSQHIDNILSDIVMQQKMLEENFNTELDLIKSQQTTSELKYNDELIAESQEELLFKLRSIEKPLLTSSFISESGELPDHQNVQDHLTHESTAEYLTASLEHENTTADHHESTELDNTLDAQDSAEQAIVATSQSKTVGSIKSSTSTSSYFTAVSSVENKKTMNADYSGEDLSDSRLDKSETIASDANMNSTKKRTDSFSTSKSNVTATTTNSSQYTTAAEDEYMTALNTIGSSSSTNNLSASDSFYSALGSTNEQVEKNNSAANTSNISSAASAYSCAVSLNASFSSINNQSDDMENLTDTEGDNKADTTLAADNSESIVSSDIISNEVESIGQFNVELFLKNMYPLVHSGSIEDKNSLEKEKNEQHRTAETSSSHSTITDADLDQPIVNEKVNITKEMAISNLEAVDESEKHLMGEKSCVLNAESISMLKSKEDSNDFTLITKDDLADMPRDEHSNSMIKLTQDSQDDDYLIAEIVEQSDMKNENQLDKEEPHNLLLNEQQSSNDMKNLVLNRVEIGEIILNKEQEFSDKNRRNRAFLDKSLDELKTKTTEVKFEKQISQESLLLSNIVDFNNCSSTSSSPTISLNNQNLATVPNTAGASATPTTNSSSSGNNTGDNVSYTSSVLEFERIEAQCNLESMLDELEETNKKGMKRLPELEEQDDEKAELKLNADKHRIRESYDQAQRYVAMTEESLLELNEEDIIDEPIEKPLSSSSSSSSSPSCDDSSRNANYSLISHDLNTIYESFEKETASSVDDQEKNDSSIDSTVYHKSVADKQRLLLEQDLSLELSSNLEDISKSATRPLELTSSLREGSPDSIKESSGELIKKFIKDSGRRESDPAYKISGGAIVNPILESVSSLSASASPLASPSTSSTRPLIIRMAQTPDKEATSTTQSSSPSTPQAQQKQHSSSQQLKSTISSRSSSSSSVKSNDSFENELKCKVKIDETSFFAKMQREKKQKSPPNFEPTKSDSALASEVRLKENELEQNRAIEMSAEATSPIEAFSSSSLTNINSKQCSTNQLDSGQCSMSESLNSTIQSQLQSPATENSNNLSRQLTSNDSLSSSSQSQSGSLVNSYMSDLSSAGMATAVTTSSNNNPDELIPERPETQTNKNSLNEEKSANNKNQFIISLNKSIDTLKKNIKGDEEIIESVRDEADIQSEKDFKDLNEQLNASDIDPNYVGLSKSDIKKLNKKKLKQITGSTRQSRTSSSTSSSSSTSLSDSTTNSSSRFSTNSNSTVIHIPSATFLNQQLQQQQTANSKQSSVFTAEDLPSFRKSSSPTPASNLPTSSSAFIASHINTLTSSSSSPSNFEHQAASSTASSSSSSNISTDTSKDNKKSSIYASHSHHSSDCYCGKQKVMEKQIGASPISQSTQLQESSLNRHTANNKGINHSKKIKMKIIK